MPNEPHHVCLGNPLLIATGNKGHTRTMKTNMSELNLAKELPPCLTWHSGHVKSGYTPLCFQLMDKGYEVWGERELSKRVFVTLGAEANGHTPYVNSPHVEACFGKPAPLMPRNQVTDPHPDRLTVQSLQNLLMLGFRNPWFLRSGVTLNAQPKTRISWRKPASHSFRHHYAKQLNLVKCCILLGFVAALVSVPFLSPVNVVPDMRPGKLPWHKYFFHPQERRDITPDTSVPLQGVRGMRVSLGEEPWNPPGPKFVRLEPSLFLLREMLRQFISPHGVQPDSVTEFSGLLLAEAGSGVNEAKPVVGAFRSLEKVGQCKSVLHEAHIGQVLS